MDDLSQSSDLYELLEVSPRASERVIHAAYRALVLSTHPDVSASSDAGERMRQLNAAYSVLSSAERRARYDLEWTRKRRYRRQGKGNRLPTSMSCAPARVHLQTLATAPQHRFHERRPALNGATVLALVILAVLLTMLVLVLLSTALDTPQDVTLSYERPHVQVENGRR